MATAYGYPRFNIEDGMGVYPLGNHAVTPRNLLVLLGSQYRGEDRLLPFENPGDPGIVSLPRHLAPGYHLLDILIKGRCDTDGAAGIDPQGQAWLNFVEVRDAVAPITTGDGLRLCELHFPPDGSTVFTADCHVGPLEFQNAEGPNIVATLEIEVPYGQFENEVS